MIQIRKVLAELMIAFPNYKPKDSETAIRVYEKHLSQFSESELKKAADSIIAKDQWFPTVSRFIAAAMEARRAGGSESVDGTQSRLDFLKREQALIDQVGQGIYHPEEWKALLREAIDTDRQCAADSIRRRIQTLEAISLIPAEENV